MEDIMKLTRQQLRRLIESYIADDKGNVVSADDAYNTALDKAAGAIDRVRAKEDRSPIGQEFVRSTDPKTVTQALELASAVGAEDDYSDFESTALKMPEDDRMPNIPMSREEATLKAKYGEGKALSNYILIYEDVTGKEVKIPIDDDLGAFYDGFIPEGGLHALQNAYRDLKKAEMIKGLKNRATSEEDLDIFYAAMNDADNAIRRIKNLEQEFLEAINSYIMNLGPYAVGKMLRLEPDHVEINTILKFINEDKYYRKWNK